MLFIQFSGSAFVEIIKLVVARTRPSNQLVADTGYSFPSGHTFCTAIMIFSLLTVILPKLAEDGQYYAIILSITWLILVIISRFYLRNHYPSDVFASLLLASGYWLRLAGLRESFERHVLNCFAKKKTISLEKQKSLTS